MKYLFFPKMSIYQDHFTWFKVLGLDSLRTKIFSILFNHHGPGT